MTLEHWFAGRGVPLMETADGAKTALRFTDAGEEHLATRRRVGLFDFSFMGSFEIAGPQALDFLGRLQVRRLDALAPGRIAYTLLCREDGTVFSDATVWRLAADRWWVFTGRRSDRSHLGPLACGFDVALAECGHLLAVCALQGPRSREVLQRAFPEVEWSSPRYFGFRAVAFSGVPCRVGCLGYSGELGFELVIEAALGPALWQRLADAGAALGLAECGFAAADSLRIEAGHILFSCELALDVTPRELGFERLVSGKGFLGAAALRSCTREQGRRLVGLVPNGSAAVPTAGLAAAERLQPGRGVLTSSAPSPLFGRALGLGFVGSEDRYPGGLVGLHGGGTARVARLPFYDPMKRLPRG